MFLSYHGVFILRRFFLSLYFCSARFHDDILVLTQKQEKLRTFNETFMVMAHFYNTHYDRVSRMDRASEKKTHHDIWVARQGGNFLPRLWIRIHKTLPHFEVSNLKASAVTIFRVIAEVTLTYLAGFWNWNLLNASSIRFVHIPFHLHRIVSVVPPTKEIVTPSSFLALRSAW